VKTCGVCQSNVLTLFRVVEEGGGKVSLRSNEYTNHLVVATVGPGERERKRGSDGKGRSKDDFGMTGLKNPRGFMRMVNCDCRWGSIKDVRCAEEENLSSEGPLTWVAKKSRKGKHLGALQGGKKKKGKRKGKQTNEKRKGS